MTDDKLKTPVDLVGRSIQQTVNLGLQKYMWSYQLRKVGVVLAGAVLTVALVLFLITMPGLFLFFIGGEVLVLDL